MSILERFKPPERFNFARIINRSSFCTGGTMTGLYLLGYLNQEQLGELRMSGNRDSAVRAANITDIETYDFLRRLSEDWGKYDEHVDATLRSYSDYFSTICRELGFFETSSGYIHENARSWYRAEKERRAILETSKPLPRTPNTLTKMREDLAVLTAQVETPKYESLSGQRLRDFGHCSSGVRQGLKSLGLPTVNAFPTQEFFARCGRREGRYIRDNYPGYSATIARQVGYSSLDAANLDAKRWELQQELAKYDADPASAPSESSPLKAMTAAEIAARA